MVLLVDVGNSSIYFGLYDEIKIQRSFRIKSFRDKTSDEYYRLVHPFIQEEKLTQVVISSVVPFVTSALNKMFKQHLKLKPLIIAPGVKNGISFKVDDPKTVGADLLCAIAGLEDNDAYIIIDLGTATKYIYVKDKTLHGVVIAPGVITSLNALVSAAALLPSVELVTPQKVLGKNTVSCMQSGILHGTACQIDGMIDRIKNEVHQEDIKLIATGGLASTIIPNCSHEIHIEDQLVLNGIINIYKLNK